ncbi:MAG: TSUP family transporter [Oscillospiraceae bacterium]|jgi:uncharacterized membrane protein YfcA|nr:TSUP family transporter [Oscillospiraceae bacterium]
MQKAKTALTGFLIGIINGFFGAGGGIAAVPLLKKQGLDEAKAHASSIAVIFALSILSAWLYYSSSSKSMLTDVLPFIPGGIAGAAAGGLLLNKIPAKWLRRIFALLMICSGARLVFV